MELLKTIRVKAATWVDTNKIVEGILFVADRITFKGADSRINQNGYLLFIVDDSGMQHIIAPDTLEIVGLNENSETAKAVYDVTMKMSAAGFTIAETETFWKDCVTSAELMIESKKRISEPLYYIQNKHAGYLGNSIFFWAVGSNGYTAKLENAHKFTYEEAKSICNGQPDKNKAWPVDYINNNKGTARVTDSQYLHEENIVDFNKNQTIEENIVEPWDERLLDAFGDLINKDGWLTSNWHEHLEANFKDWDEDGNTTNDKKFLYGLMYNLDYEESEDGKFIRPIKQNKLDQKPKRLFVVGEEINHKKYGLGKVKEVFPTKIVIQFNDREHPLKFVTYLFEENLIQNDNSKCMLFKLEFQERNEYAQAKSLSHLREEYEKEYGDNEPLLEEMITIISEEEAKKIMLKNMDESTSEECPEFSLWDIAGGDYFAVLATTEWD